MDLRTKFRQNVFREMRTIIVAHGEFAISNSTLVAAITFNEELVNLGYTLRPNDIVELAKQPTSFAFQRMLNNIREYIGDVKAKPMYPNFPKQVMNMGNATFRFHQICHYFSTYGIEALTGAAISRGWLPDVEDTEKTKTDDTLLGLKVLDVLWFDTLDEAVEPIMRKVLSKRERLTIPEQEIIALGIKISFIPECAKNFDIPFKENMCELFYAIFTDKDVFKNLEFYSFCQHTGDVWKCIDYLMNEKDINHFRTSQKRVLVKLLESYPAVDFTTNLILSNKSANKIKILLNYLDFNTYSRSAPHKDAVARLRNGELRSWEGKAKELIFSKNTDAIEFISKRPGMMVRMITLLLRNGFNTTDIGNALERVADKLSTQTLVTLATFFGMPEMPKNRKGEDRDMIEVSRIYALINICINANLKAKNIPELKGKRVYIDMDNYDLNSSTIECNTKSSEGGYIRSGLAYRIPEDVRRIRFFVYWNDSSRVDVDLHAKLVHHNGAASNIGWDAAYKNEVAAFSGDITHSDAAEYIDIDLGKAKKVCSKANLNINLYDGKPSFGQIDECFVGIMAVNNIGEEVKLYDPKNCFFTHYLKGNCRFYEYGYIDITNRCLVFLGKEAAGYYSSKAHATSAFSVSAYIFALLQSQYVTLATTKEDADVILTMEKSTDEKAISLLDNNFFMER
jgi:hypothetical protein